jgi:hypothetical protein
MACFTKTKKTNRRPRCSAITKSLHQCKYYGVEYIGGHPFCIKHAFRIRNKKA